MARSLWRWMLFSSALFAAACAHPPRAGWSPLPEIVYTAGTPDVPTLYVRVSPEGEVEALDRRSVVRVPRRGQLLADEELRIRAIVGRLPEKARFRVEKAENAQDQIQLNARVGAHQLSSDPEAEEHPVLVEFSLAMSELYQRIWSASGSR